MTAQIADSVTDASEERDGRWTPVHRIVTPAGDLDTLSLYVDFNPLRRPLPQLASDALTDPEAQRAFMPNDQPASAEQRGFILDRRRIQLPPQRLVSFGTYFNAFPAGYWRAWTDVETVRLNVRTTGKARVFVYRSSSRGFANRVASIEVDTDQQAQVDLPLANFGDGGWYWFDLYSGPDGATLEEASWSAPEDAARGRGRVSVAITTFNRPDFCVRQLSNIASAPDLLEVLDRVIIVDQGTQKVVDEPDYEPAAARLGDRLHIIDQGNLGGSGGFARGMHETAENESSDYVLLLDDDVIVETEGIVRAAAFADYTRTPTIVGGHMFSLYERTVLHTWGERVDEYRFFWGPVPGTREAHDFSEHNLRSTTWMHRRVDVDYNGWWMCLIPTRIIREIGLALPVFIKWDDSEYGLRARAHGYQTVSLPGAAVWHMPWTDKDDTIDWQAYYHQRNRWLAALLYSPYDGGGSLPRESFMVDVKHLLSLQYSAVELRHHALRDVLSGPEHLHRTIGSNLGKVRGIRAKFPDAQVTRTPADLPLPTRTKPPKKGRLPAPPRGVPRAMRAAIMGAARQLVPVSEAASERPQARVPAMDARWWRLSQLDSAVVSTADGAGASWYRRDRAQFFGMLSRSLKLHLRLRAEWKVLQRVYRADLPNFTDQERWKATFERSTS